MQKLMYIKPGILLIRKPTHTWTYTLVMTHLICAFIFELITFEQVEYALHGVGLKWDQEGKCFI